MRSNVRERSRAAVVAAGTRKRGAPVQTAGAWQEKRGRQADGPFRPGKTARKRRRGRS